MKSDAVRSGAKRFAAELDGPFGRRSLHWAVQLHLKYFTAARAAGATWSQIAQALALAGAVAGDGTAIKSNVLSATVSRIERSARPKSEANSKTALAHFDERLFETIARPTNGGAIGPTSPPIPKHPTLSLLPVLPADLATVRERMDRTADLRGKHR
jgi:hypothetical protein